MAYLRASIFKSISSLFALSFSPTHSRYCDLMSSLNLALLSSKGLIGFFHSLDLSGGAASMFGEFDFQSHFDRKMITWEVCFRIAFQIFDHVSYSLVG